MDKNNFTYKGYMCKDAQEFFKNFIIEEERQGCAVVGNFIKLKTGNTHLPSKGDKFIKDDNGISLV